MIAQELEVTIHMTFVAARKSRHEYVTVEHLLLGLLDNSSAVAVLTACGANIEHLRKRVVVHLTENSRKVPGRREVDTMPTLSFQRAIQRAILRVQAAGDKKRQVTGADVLLAMFDERTSEAARLLRGQKVTRRKVENIIDSGITNSGSAQSAAG